MNHSSAVARALLTASECGAMVAQRTVGLFTDKRGNLRSIGIMGEADIQGVAADGRALAIEIKTNNATTSKEQKKWAKAFKARNGLYVLARYSDTSDGDEQIREALGHG